MRRRCHAGLRARAPKRPTPGLTSGSGPPAAAWGPFRGAVMGAPTSGSPDVEVVLEGTRVCGPQGPGVWCGQGWRGRLDPMSRCPEAFLREAAGCG